MPKTGALFLFLAAALCLSAAEAAADEGIPERPEAIASAPLKYSPPEPAGWTLPNGLKVYYLRNDEIPLVQGRMYFPGGEVFDTSGIPGLAGAAGDQMRSGSILGMAPAALDAELDRLAATVESEFGTEFGMVSFRCLADDFPRVFELFSKVIETPAFAPGRLDLWKKITSQRISRRRERPDTIAGMAFRRLIFGQESPYGRTVSLESLRSITPEKMKSFHRRFVSPRRAILSVSGAVSEQVLREAVEREFGNWNMADNGTLETPIAKELSPVPGIYLHQRPLDQAVVIFGHMGPPRRTDDEWAIFVYNRIVGEGGFGTELFKEIRSRLGLAYSVYGGMWPDRGAGLFQVSLSTKPHQVPKALSKSLEVIKLTLAEAPGQGPLSAAKENLSKVFLFKFATADQVVNRFALLPMLGYDKTFDEQYLERVAAVTPQAVHQAAVRWIDPEKAVVVVVGDIKPEQLREAFPGMPVFEFAFDTEPEFKLGQ